MATHQYGDHNQSYVPDARLEKGHSVCDVDAGAGTPFADLVSHIILYIPSNIRVILPTLPVLFTLRPQKTYLDERVLFQFQQIQFKLNSAAFFKFNRSGDSFHLDLQQKRCEFAFVRVLSITCTSSSILFRARCRYIQQIEVEITSIL